MAHRMYDINSKYEYRNSKKLFLTGLTGSTLYFLPFLMKGKIIILLTSYLLILFSSDFFNLLLKQTRLLLLGLRVPITR